MRKVGPEFLPTFNVFFRLTTLVVGSIVLSNYNLGDGSFHVPQKWASSSDSRRLSGPLELAEMQGD